MFGSILVSSLPIFVCFLAGGGPAGPIGQGPSPVAPVAPPLSAAQIDAFAKALEAVTSHSQWLTSLALVAIGGSMLVLMHRDYVRPETLLGRAFFLFFVVGWACLAYSVWKGARVQEVHLAFLITPPASQSRLEHLEDTLDRDLSGQVNFLLGGLAAFALWLLSYMVWWLGGGDLRGAAGRARTEAPRKDTRHLTAVVCLATLGALSSAAGATAQCDCDHFPYNPNPPCRKVCSLRVFKYSTAAELTLMGIDPALARSIVDAKAHNPEFSLADLPPATQRQVETALGKAQPIVLRYLASPPDQKLQLADKIEALYQKGPAGTGEQRDKRNYVGVRALDPPDQHATPAKPAGHEEHRAKPVKPAKPEAHEPPPPPPPPAAHDSAQEPSRPPSS